MRLPSSSGVLALPDPKTVGQWIMTALAVGMVLWLVSGIKFKSVAEDLFGNSATAAIVSTR